MCIDRWVMIRLTGGIMNFFRLLMALGLMGASLHPAAAVAPRMSLPTLSTLSHKLLQKAPEMVSDPALSLEGWLGTGKARGWFGPLISSKNLRRIFNAYQATLAASPHASPAAWMDGDKVDPLPDTVTTDMVFKDDVFLSQIQHQKYFAQRMIVSEGADVLFMGDMHGSVHSLLRNLWHLVTQGFLDDTFTLRNPRDHMVFLGDFVDRGAYGTEVLYMILRLKLANWDNVHILRGNHEEGLMAKNYGFFSELKTKYEKQAEELYLEFVKFCNTLPCAVFLGAYDKVEHKNVFIQCCHGGIEPYHDPKPLLNAEDQKVIYQRINPTQTVHLLSTRLNERMAACRHNNVREVSEEKSRYTPGAGYMWSDLSRLKSNATLLLDGKPFQDGDTPIWFINGLRGTGFLASPREVDYELDRCGVKKIIRGHQDYSSCFMMIVPESEEHPCDVTDDCDRPWDWRLYPHIPSTMKEGAHLLETQGFNFASLPHALTLSTAGEGRGNWAEGYGLLHITKSYDSWSFYVHEQLLEPVPCKEKMLHWLHTDLSPKRFCPRYVGVRLTHEGRYACSFFEEKDLTPGVGRHLMRCAKPGSSHKHCRSFGSVGQPISLDSDACRLVKPVAQRAVACTPDATTPLTPRVATDMSGGGSGGSSGNDEADAVTPTASALKRTVSGTLSPLSSEEDNDEGEAVDVEVMLTEMGL